MLRPSKSARTESLAKGIGGSWKRLSRQAARGTDPQQGGCKEGAEIQERNLLQLGQAR